MRTIVLALTMVTLSSICVAEVANMSGSWWLNVKRSRWEDNKRPPNSVALTIEHNEPALKYSGIVNGPGEDDPRKFEFNGAIDGKAYGLVEDGKEQRKITFKRRSDRVIESESTLPGGQLHEHTTMTLSGDGRTLERKMEVRGGAGKGREWVEIYEKRQ